MPCPLGQTESPSKVQEALGGHRRWNLIHRVDTMVSDQFENIDWEALWAKHHTNQLSRVRTRAPLSEAWKSSLWSHWVWETKHVWIPSPYALTHCFSSYAPIRNNPRAMSQSLLLRTVWQRKRRGLPETLAWASLFSAWRDMIWKKERELIIYLGTFINRGPPWL